MAKRLENRGTLWMSGAGGLLRPKDGQDSGVPRRWPVDIGFSSHALGEEGGELGRGRWKEVLGADK